MTLINIMNLPETSKMIKIVQLHFKDKPFLLCRSKQPGFDPNYYHANTVQDFLMENNITPEIDYNLIQVPGKSNILVPAVKVDGIYEIVGAGFAEINYEEKYFYGYSSSSDYKKLGINGLNEEFNNLIDKELEKIFNK